MQTHNGTSRDGHHAFEQRVDAFKDGVAKLADRVFAEPREESRLKAAIAKAVETIKAHPVAAAAVALGLGYILMRSVRR
jgi:hypothetical protein